MSDPFFFLIIAAFSATGVDAPPGLELGDEWPIQLVLRGHEFGTGGQTQVSQPAQQVPGPLSQPPAIAFYKYSLWSYRPIYINPYNFFVPK